MGAYGKRPTPERVVILMSAEELRKIDEWGAPTGKASRSEAIRELIFRGLRVVASDQIVEDKARGEASN